MTGAARDGVHRFLVTARAVGSLGWVGHVAAEIDLLGDRVDVAYSWSEERHRDRLAAGIPPLADPWMLDCVTSSHPGSVAQPAPVNIVGVLVRRKAWLVGRRVAAGFSAFGPVAVLLPPDRVGALEQLDADRLGMGLLTDTDPPVLMVPPASFTPPDWTPVQRLVQETVYAAAWNAIEGSTAMACAWVEGLQHKQRNGAS